MQFHAIFHAHYTPNISKISPAATAIPYNTAIIFTFSFLSGFTLNKTTRPIPAPVHNPAITDENEIAPYAKESVKSLYTAGVINGKEMGFAPQSNASRAEAAKMMYELWKGGLKND